MPNDAKLGLVLGMGLVVLITLVFFRKDSAVAQPSSQKEAAPITAPKTNPAKESPPPPPLPAEPPTAVPMPTDPLVEPAPAVFPGSGD